MSCENIFDKLSEYGGSKKAKTLPITALEAKEAFAFLMSHDRYCTTELPEYFDFNGVLEYAATAIGVKNLDEVVASGVCPKVCMMSILMSSQIRMGNMACVRLRLPIRSSTICLRVIFAVSSRGRMCRSVSRLLPRSTLRLALFRWWRLKINRTVQGCYINSQLVEQDGAAVAGTVASI